jgi:hypothetical protein
MKLGPGGTWSFANGWAGEPRVEGEFEWRAEPALVQRCERIVSVVLRFDPRVERGDVEQPLLPPEREELVRLDPDRRGLSIELGLLAVPPRGLVAAPGSRDRHDRQQARFEDLDEPFPARILGLGLRIARLGEPAGYLHVEVFGHASLAALGRVSV